MTCASASLCEVNGWTGTFPAEVTSLQNATLFMKKLLAVAISNITYLRNIFPENAFGSRTLADLNIKILSENSSCAAACEVISWVRGCFEALEYKYLRQIMLGIHTEPGDHDNVIESYTFRFNYTKEGTSVTCNGEELCNSSGHDMQLTKKATLSLLRTIILLTQTLEPLPSNSYMTMKLLYYDDVTPPDYEPCGFVPAETDNFFFSGAPVNIRAGEVSTAYHSLKVRIKVEKKQFDIEDDEPIPSASLQLESSYQSEDSPKPSYAGSEYNFDDNIPNENEEYVEEEQNQDGVSVAESSKSVNMEGGDEKKAGGRSDQNNDVRCPCGYQKEEGLMISCTKCGLWQHGVCFGILEEEESPENHICEMCYTTDSGGIKPNHREFYNLKLSDIQALCLWRRALVSVLDLKTVQANIVSKRLNIDKSDAAKIIDRLEDEGYVTPGAGKFKGKKYVNRALIEEEGFRNYVRRTPKSFSSDRNLSVDELDAKTKDLHISGGADVSAPYQLRGRKRGKGNLQDFEVNDGSQELDFGDETRRKRKKASTCISGIPLPHMT